MVGVVGVLQLEVLEYRLNTEYNVEIRMQQLPFEQLRWVQNDPDTYNLRDLDLTSDTKAVEDMKGNRLLLFTSDWAVRWAETHNETLATERVRQHLIKERCGVHCAPQPFLYRTKNTTKNASIRMRVPIAGNTAGTEGKVYAEYLNIGKSGIAVPFLGMGTWAIGGGAWWGDNDDALSVKAIQTAVEQGIQWIDTAPIYGLYHSENVVGEAMKHIDRDKVVLSTKCGLEWRHETPVLHKVVDGTAVYRDLSAQSIIEDVEDSLRRLHTDHLDVLYTHWQSPDFGLYPLEETMEAMMKLKEQGKSAPSVLPTSPPISSGATASTASWTSFRKSTAC